MRRVDPAKIGFWGLSQSGWLAVLAAERSKNAISRLPEPVELSLPLTHLVLAVLCQFVSDDGEILCHIVLPIRNSLRRF
jgi:hypothetical protein